MLIHYDPDAWVPEGTITTCDYHRANPGVPYAGCTCGGSFGMRRATPEERAERRRVRLTKRRADLKAELAAIEREIGATPETEVTE